MRRFKKVKLRDLTDKNGQRYIERYKNECDSFGNIITDCTRDCTFFRRGECYLRDYLGNDIECNRICYWQSVREDGYLMDRDGWVGICNNNLKYAIRIDENRGMIDSNGKPLGFTNKKTGEFKQYFI